MHEKLDDKVEIIGINVGINENPEGVRNYVSRNGLGFTVIYDEGAKLTKSFGVMGTPTHIVIDRQGTVRYLSADIPEDLAEHINELLG